MFRKILLIITMVTFGVAIAAWAGTVSYDFADNKAEGWTVVGGEWEIKNGGYYGNEPEAQEGLVILGDESWGPDYTIECKVRDSKGVWLGIFLRYKDIDNSYQWWVDLGNSLATWYIKKEGEYTETSNNAIPLDLSKEFTIKAEANGFTFNGYFNGELIGTYTDEEKSFEKGPVGLSVWEAEATYDDVIIAGLGVTTSVKSQGRLATTWSKIKLMH